MNIGYVQFIAGTGGIVGQDVWATIDRELHIHSPELAKEMQLLVQNLTPIRTGALLMDIAYDAYLTEGFPEIAWVYAETIAQQAFWNRVYVQYQEGGPLGEHTYTNDPHEMFFDTANGDGLDLVYAWAGPIIQDALYQCSIGTGVHWSATHP